MPLSNPQKQIANDTHRFRVAICGRRFGKTHLAIRELARHARTPNQEVIYVAPSYKMAKNIVWRKLKNRLQDLNWVKKINETELKLELKNGSIIALKGADNFDSLRGVGNHFIVLDEFADIDPEAWFEVLRPTLSDTGGKALFIGTPKGVGNWSYEIYQNALEDPEQWSSYQFTTIDGGNVPQEEIEQAKKDLTQKIFEQEYLASFITFSGRVAWAFEREYNVRQLENPDTKILHIGIDFNVNPVTAVVFIQQGNDLYAIDEIVLYSSNSNELCDEIKSRYPSSKIWAYPDPSGSARKTSANGYTDHIILQNAGFIVKAPRKHTPVKDRINAFNNRLCSADGVRHLFISPKCKYTIESLEKFCFKEGSQIPDKDSGFDHIFDAASYCVDYLFPIKRDREEDPYAAKRWTHGIKV